MKFIILFFSRGRKPPLRAETEPVGYREIFLLFLKLENSKTFTILGYSYLRRVWKGIYGKNGRHDLLFFMKLTKWELYYVALEWLIEKLIFIWTYLFLNKVIEIVNKLRLRNSEKLLGLESENIKTLRYGHRIGR